MAWGNKMKSSQILVVDDEEFFLKLMFQTLRKEGGLVRTAQSGEEAAHWLRREVFDLAIVDIRMERTDGFEILEEVKRLYPQMKVIMVTGFPSPDTQALCIQKGADGYLVKPIEINELKKAIQSVLN